jgi:hypothetical protein
MRIWIDIIPDGAVWLVRCQSAEYGRYRTQVQAFNAAVAEARRIQETGRSAHVRVMRGGEGQAGDFVSLL